MRAGLTLTRVSHGAHDLRLARPETCAGGGGKRSPDLLLPRMYPCRRLGAMAYRYMLRNASDEVRYTWERMSTWMFA